MAKRYVTRNTGGQKIPDEFFMEQNKFGWTYWKKRRHEVNNDNEKSDSSEKNDIFRGQWIWVCLVLGFVSLRNSELSSRDPRITDLGGKLEIKRQFNFSVILTSQYSKTEKPRHLQ